MVTVDMLLTYGKKKKPVLPPLSINWDTDDKIRYRESVNKEDGE